MRISTISLLFVLFCARTGALLIHHGDEHYLSCHGISFSKEATAEEEKIWVVSRKIADGERIDLAFVRNVISLDKIPYPDDSTKQLSCSVISTSSTRTAVHLRVKCISRCVPENVDPAQDDTKRFLAVDYPRKINSTVAFSPDAGDFADFEIERLARRAFGGSVAVERDVVARFIDPRSDSEPFFRTEAAVRSTQSDPTWALDRIDQRANALDGLFSQLGDGADVDIYVVDTGVRTTHSDFEGRANFLINTVGDSLNTDCNGHGTHVAACAAGKRYGVAKGAAVFAVKSLTCAGDGSSFSILAGLAEVSDHRRSRAGRKAVVNLSIGGPPSSGIDSALADMVNFQNIAVCVAAGNQGSDACLYSPARERALLTVGASDRSDSKPSWSNRGPCVDLYAPGTDVLSAWHTSDSATMLLSGTSMATPFVTGTVATLLQQMSVPYSVAAVQNSVAAWATRPGPNKVELLLYSPINASLQAPPVPTPPPLAPHPSTAPTIRRRRFLRFFVTLLAFWILASRS